MTRREGLDALLAETTALRQQIERARECDDALSWLARTSPMATVEVRGNEVSIHEDRDRGRTLRRTDAELAEAVRELVRAHLDRVVTTTLGEAR